MPSLAFAKLEVSGNEMRSRTLNVVKGVTTIRNGHELLRLYILFTICKQLLAGLRTFWSFRVLFFAMGYGAGLG